MEFSREIVNGAARSLMVDVPEAVVVIPESLDACQVIELWPYVLAGSQAEEIYLPAYLEKIGAYGFYGCEKLQRIHAFSRVNDLGAGLFAGVRSVEFLELTEYEGERSCFKELLSELRQTLRVRLHAGGREARLIFPEYFEESVENTPARILFIETHGCGHRYRYCFSGRQFQYRGYDELFPHVKVQEPEALVTELALGRLQFPVELTPHFEEMYLDYVREHWQEAGRLLIAADRISRDQVTNLDPGGLRWLVQDVLPADFAYLDELVAMAQQAGDTETVSWLMDWRHRSGKQPAGQGKKRRFEL